MASDLNQTRSDSSEQHHDLDQLESLLWRRFMSTNTRLMERLDHDLQERSHLSITDFEILSTLSREPSQRIRMSDLATVVLVSRSRLTYRIDRLTKVGLVTREECDLDKRGMWAILTRKGKNTLAKATPGYAADIHNRFLAHLDADAIVLLNNLLSLMDDNLARS